MQCRSTTSSLNDSLWYNSLPTKNVGVALPFDLVAKSGETNRLKWMYPVFYVNSCHLFYRPVTSGNVSKISFQVI